MAPNVRLVAAGCARLAPRVSSDGWCEPFADLGNDVLWPPCDVGGRVPQDAIAGVHQEVLAPIVLDKSLTMVAAVKLDHQPRGPEQKVGPCQKATGSVTHFSLDLGTRDSRLQQHPAKARFHW